MKIELFTPVTYYDENKRKYDWPFPQRLFDSEKGRLSVQYGFEEFAAGHEAGFDSLNLAEHHYSPSQMTPAPHIFAAALGERFPDAQIAILGTDLLLHNPINIAEQYSALDNQLGGRLRFALLRGTPNEYLTYGTNPWESRAKFEEAVQLIIRAFNEPEPFGWEGRYYRFRNISLFPAPAQRPHPRIMLSGNSISSAAFAGRMKCDLGVSFMAPEIAAASVTAYREAAAAAGWNPTADNILYRQFVHVTETDEEAQRLVAETGWPNGGSSFESRNAEIGQVMFTSAAAIAGVPKGVVPDMSKAPAFGAPWLGTPEAVLAQMRHAAETLGAGRLELNYTGLGGEASHESVVRSIKLTGETIIPALKAGDTASH
ncbi:LLM class flavin-dependent oxidoreductase [Nocardia asiatica]|uniref:LLM class flavin-dependent oxidoreductase n=1 Tax=Nocardia asiatica TaxID=209252 RepID=UPI0002E1D900|nr:LLM class flavin-dependent oxidoreductase [Nocardia asiatica]